MSNIKTEEVIIEEVEPLSEQSSMIVQPDELLAQIVAFIGGDFVVMPTLGWMKIVKTIQKYEKGDKKENLLDILEGLNVSIIPVSLSPKQDESRIITPTGTPIGDSNIITP